MRLRPVLWILSLAIILAIALAAACGPAPILGPPCWYDSDCGSPRHCVGVNSFTEGHCEPACTTACSSGYCDVARGMCVKLWAASFEQPHYGDMVTAPVGIRAVVKLKYPFSLPDGGIPRPPNRVLFSFREGFSSPWTPAQALNRDGQSTEYVGTFSPPDSGTWQVGVRVEDAHDMDHQIEVHATVP